MIKYIFCSIALINSILGQEYNQKDVDSLRVLIQLSEKSPIYAKEVNLLKSSLEGTSLKIIADGYLAFKKGNVDEAVEFFESVREDNVYFGLMAETFSNLLRNSDTIKKEHINTLLRMIFETDLREKYKLSFGCVKGLDHAYEEMIKDDPEKKASFKEWKAKKLQAFYDAAPGNWYHCLSEGCYVDLKSFREVTESVEAVLLGFKKPNENFNRDWKKVNNLKEKFLDRITDLQWAEEVPYQELMFQLEELRLHILAGKVTIVNKAFPIIKQHIFRYIDKHKSDKVDSSPFDDLLGKFYYIQGVHRFIIGKEKQLKDLEARDDFIGKKGAAVSLYFSAQKGGSSTWVEKSKKLYKYLQENSEKWFDVKIIDIFKSK